MLKEIGAAARRELEEYYENKVYLDLWIKVEPHWREQEVWLRRFGYRRTES
ncbi:MAG: KH domain-containing protein [Firmicutes bacterium]|nr:KH domain-containing protein [Bacillota bacterium]